MNVALRSESHSNHQETRSIQLSRKLFDAIEKGDHGLAWRYIREGADLAGLDESTGLSPLAFAVQSGRIELVRILLEAGADPNWGGDTTPLEQAAVEADVEMLDLLISSGADIDRRVADGNTPLMTAAALGYSRIVHKLLSAGSRPLLRDDHGQSAIAIAIAHGHPRIAEQIRTFERKRRKNEKQANLYPTAFRDQKTPSSGTPVFTGSSSLSPRSSSGSGGFSAFKPPGPSTPLPAPEPQAKIEDFARLLETGELEPAQRLAERSIFDVTSRTVEGKTPLALAAIAGATDVGAVLLARGAAVDATCGGDAETALILAIQKPSPGRTAFVDLLLRAGAKLDRRTGMSGMTPLMVAASADVYQDQEPGEAFGHVTQRLIDAGADLEARDRRGTTVWQIIKRQALGAPTFSPYRRRLQQMLRLLETAGAVQVAMHEV